MDLVHGDIVLIDIRFHQAEGSKIRPVVVVLDSGDQDFVAIPVTPRKQSGRDKLIHDLIHRLLGILLPGEVSAKPVVQRLAFFVSCQPTVGCALNDEGSTAFLQIANELDRVKTGSSAPKGEPNPCVQLRLAAAGNVHRPFGRARAGRNCARFAVRQGLAVHHKETIQLSSGWKSPRIVGLPVHADIVYKLAESDEVGISSGTRPNLSCWANNLEKVVHGAEVMLVKNCGLDRPNEMWKKTSRYE